MTPPITPPAHLEQPPFLPMSRPEMERLGWDALDVLLVSGDAYVDHPSFGMALLGRWLVAHGFRTGIVAQPPWQGAGVDALTCMGRPRLFTGVGAGALDSMLAHYTAFRKKRHDDAYTPGGLAGARPNRACIAYTGMVRRAFSGMPVVLGGIEASLRRAVHYDFWADALRRPLLLDSKADILVYGMGERALLAIAQAAEQVAANQENVTREALRQACAQTPGTVLPLRRNEAESLCANGLSTVPEAPASRPVLLPSFEAIAERPALLMEATLALESHVHLGTGELVQLCEGGGVRINAPAPALDEGAMDRLYALPFSGLPHPALAAPVPAWEMIRTSITTHRGCGGGCSFCSLALHQGRRIASRSRKSILAEAVRIAAGPQVFAPSAPSGLSEKSGRSGTVDRAAAGGKSAPRWAGSISDVGGPSANMWQATCSLPSEKACSRRSCLHPAPCPFFVVDQGRGARLLRDIAALPGVRHVRVASGVRFDLALKDSDALHAYTSEFTGGQLKVAPEHSADNVLRLMRKPGLAVFERFLEAFSRDSRNAGKEQYTVPYLMSAFPGCTMDDMRALGRWLKQRNWSPRQIQCFIPTPGTVATAMFYAGTDPDGSPLYVARTDRERLQQHHVLTAPHGRSDQTARPRTHGGNRAAPEQKPARRTAKGRPHTRRKGS